MKKKVQLERFHDQNISRIMWRKNTEYGTNIET